MNKLKFTPTAYGWLVEVGNEDHYSWYLNGDEDHQNEPTILSADNDGWKIKFKNVSLTINYTGSVSNIHVH